MANPVPPYAYCSGCKKPSWNQRDIGFSKWKWGKYMCIACSPMTQSTQPPPETQNEEEAGAPASPVEPLYIRPQEEVQKELDWLADTNNRIEDIPFG